MPPLGPSVLDTELLVKRIGIMERQHAALMAAFAPEEVLDIDYEEINADLAGTAAKLRRYLDAPEKPFNVPFEKATSDDLREAVVNYDEVMARLNGTDYVRFL